MTAVLMKLPSPPIAAGLATEIVARGNQAQASPISLQRNIETARDAIPSGLTIMRPSDPPSPDRF